MNAKGNSMQKQLVITTKQWCFALFM